MACKNHCTHSPLFDTKEYEYLWEDIKKYVCTRFDLFKLEFLQKFARVIGLVLFGIATVLIAVIIIAFGGVAAIFAMAEVMPTWAATLIMMGGWLLILVLVIAFRKQLFYEPMLLAISSILFDNEPKRNDEELERDRLILATKEQEERVNVERQAERIQHSWDQMVNSLKRMKELCASLNPFRLLDKKKK